MNCSLTKNIHLDDLPEDWRQIAELIGLDETLKIIQARQGESLYCPKLESIQVAARNRAIHAEFNGRNYRELAKKFGLTVRWVRAILAGQADSSQTSKPVDRQLQLF